jgi:hypothetical protein
MIIVMAIVLLLVAMYAYRIFLMFNSSKIKSYVKDEANKTDSPDAAYKMLIEGVELILKSPDLTNQVKQLAVIDGIDPEKALVKTALNQCHSNGFINRVIVPTNGDLANPTKA